MSGKIRLLDSISLTLLSVVVFGGFLWLSVLNVIDGASSGDDAWISLAAKNLAVGKGYSTSLSSTEFVHFDPFISTGPPLVLPVALLIFLFGPVSWMPGALQLVLFLGQLLIVTSIFAKRSGWARSWAYISAVVLFICLASAYGWFFGGLLGEPVALGFIIIGTALLARVERGRDIAIAGVCLALAFLTKQIAVFSVAGVILAWLVSGIYERTSPSVILRRLALLLLAGASMPIAFESIKLVAMGFARYQAQVQKTLAFGSGMSLGANAMSDRWASFFSIVSSSYLPWPIVCGLFLGSLILIARLAPRRDVGGVATRFATLAWTGAAVHALYFATLSTHRVRYLWIGFAIALAAATAPMLLLKSRGRIATIAALLATTLLFELYKPLEPLHRLLTTSPRPRERSAVVEILDSKPAMPYAAQYWSSIYDIVYLRDSEGTWTFGHRVNDLRDRDFIAIVNRTFTDRKSDFYIAVDATCELLTKDASHLRAYQCDSRFWEIYP